MTSGAAAGDPRLARGDRGRWPLAGADPGRADRRAARPGCWCRWCAALLRAAGHPAAPAGRHRLVGVADVADQSPAAAAQRRRLSVLRLLLGSLLLTLVARLAFVQLLDQHKPRAVGRPDPPGQLSCCRRRAGQILDSRGRVLVGNQHHPRGDGRPLGAETAGRPGRRGAGPAGRRPAHHAPPTCAAQITPCGVHVPAPCWTGEPYQPVPVATAVDAGGGAGGLRARRAVPGRRDRQPDRAGLPRRHPGRAPARLHRRGHATDQKAEPRAGRRRHHRAQRAGAVLRLGAARGGRPAAGTAGRPRASRSAPPTPIAAQPGDTLVTSIDADVQALAEQALADQIAASRAKGKPAPSGAVVVMDPHTGRVIAAASYPTYDPPCSSAASRSPTTRS